MIGYGILGCGWVASSHAAAVKALDSDGVRLVAVADADRSRAEQVAEQYDAPHVYADYHELLERPDVQAVSICLPDFLHHVAAIEAARAGKHVLCEKPLAVNTEAAMDMLQEFEQRHLNLGIVLNHRYSPDNMRVKRAMEREGIGDVVLGTLVHSSALSGNEDGRSPWRGKPNRAAGGVLASQGIHFIDQLLWFMGPAVAVKALTNNVKGISESEDVAAVVLRVASGALATVAATNAAPVYSDLAGTHLELHGTQGRIVLSQGQLTIFESKIQEQAPEVRLPELGSAPAGDFGRGHFYVVADFVLALRNGEPPPVSSEDGAHLTAVLDAAYRSASSGLEEPVTAILTAYRSMKPTVKGDYLLWR